MCTVGETAPPTPSECRSANRKPRIEHEWARNRVFACCVRRRCRFHSMFWFWFFATGWKRSNEKGHVVVWMKRSRLRKSMLVRQHDSQTVVSRVCEYDVAMNVAQFILRTRVISFHRK